MRQLHGVSSRRESDGCAAWNPRRSTRSMGFSKSSLAEQNRVRLEQVRDMIEQDGTKAKTAVVTVKGDLSQTDGKWVLQPPSLPGSYEIEAASPAAGPCTVSGEVAKLKPRFRARWSSKLPL